MRTSLKLGLAILTTLLVAGCGGDGFTSDEHGGAAGSGASAGNGGAGASGSGQAGGAGASGAGGAGAGSGGSAGSSSGGNAGSASAGMGGASGSGGTGGTGGSSGAAGSGACEPGTFDCEGDLLRKCSDQGTWMSVAGCDTGLCSKDAKTCLKCKPGQPTSCADEHTKKICNDDGMGEHPVACESATNFCMGGVCGQCNTDNDCPSPSQECLEAACVNAQCGTKPAMSGKVTKTQVEHDCKQQVCDGAGGLTSKADPTDVPAEDGNPCTDASCAGTQPQTTNTTAGMTCSLNGVDGVCTGTGLCADCVPNATRCTGNQLETCSAQGKWVASDCSLPTPVCSEGACVGVKQLSAGWGHTCALLDDGRLRCWGGNATGALGNGQSGPALVEQSPIKVPGLEGVKQVAAGGAHTCALKADTSVSCWGDNEVFQLGAGDGAQLIEPSPVPVVGLKGVSFVGAGAAHNCAVRENGELFCWGNNESGQLGVGQVDAQSTPKQVITLADVKQVTLGGSHTCAATTDVGNISCWGSDSDGQLGNGTNISGPQFTPVAVPGVKAAFMASGKSHVVVKNEFGQILAWGDDSYQQLGDGKATDQQGPAATAFPNFVVSMAGGDAHTCLVSSGGVLCVGRNYEGELGNGEIQTTMYSSPQSPTAVARGAGAFLADVVEIVAGTNHNCARTSKGEVLCWGDNTAGQLGIGTADKLKTFATPVKW